MKKILSIILALVVISSLTKNIVMYVGATTTEIEDDKIYSTATLEDNFAPDSILVVLNNQTSLKCKSYSQDDFPEIDAMCVRHITSLTESKVIKAKESILATSRGEKATLVEDIDLGEFKQVLYVELKEPGKDKVLNSINELKKRDEVFYVGPNYYLESHSDNSNQTYENYFENHWAYDLINLEDALDELTNNMPNVLVGVIDSGIDGTHPDLVNYIDEDLSADFAHDDDDDPLVDDHGHGTMVAGIIRGVCNKV